MSEWQQCSLGDVLTLQRGFDITKATQNAGNVPVVSSSGINSFHNQAMVAGPGVVIGRKGTLGTCFYIERPFWPHDTTLWVKDFKENDRKFCYYFLLSMELAKYDVGAANPTLNRNQVHLLPVLKAPLDIQRRIATILGAYDDLIEINRRRVALLEDMTRRLFEEWFVRFRFPDHENVAMVETPNGPLPEGWRWSSFGEMAIEVRDGVSPSDVPPETPYIGLEHIPRRSTTMTEWGQAADVGSLKLSFQRGDVLFGKIRPYFHKVVWAPFAGVASSDAIIYRPREPQFAAMALAVASSDGFVAASVQTSNGTKMPRANPAVLRCYRIAIDDGKWAARFGSAIVPSIELAASLAAANHSLSAARDLLLPRLISGQLSVAAAERELQDAA